MKHRIILWISKTRNKIGSLANSSIMKVVIITPPFSSLIMFILWISFSKFFPPLIPLYYSKPWGEEQLTEPIFLLLLPLGSLLWYGVSILMVTFSFHQYRVFSQLLFIAQAVCSLGCLYVMVRILLLIF